jgi:DNA-binding FadR family transcriptional regulator
MALAHSTQNPLFEIMLNPLFDSLLAEIRLALNYEKAMNEAEFFHKEIVKRIMSHDVKGSGLAMDQHLNQSRNAVLAALSKRDEKKTHRLIGSNELFKSRIKTEDSR